MTPLPSRSIRNCTFPLDRRWVSQPRTSMVSPIRPGASDTRIHGIEPAAGGDVIALLEVRVVGRERLPPADRILPLARAFGAAERGRISDQADHACRR